MCGRCIIGTFVSSAVLGAILGLGFVGAKSLFSEKERVVSAPYRATHSACNHAPHQKMQAVYFTENSRKPAVLTPSLPTKIAYNFPNARLLDVAHFMGTYTKRTFVAGPGVDMNQEVTFISSTPASIGDSYRAFLKLLSMKGLALYQQGNVSMIIKNGSIPPKTKADKMPKYKTQPSHRPSQSPQPNAI